MRYILLSTLCLGLLGLVACDQSQQQSFEVPEQRSDMSSTMQMYHLHMLINHALQMAAQGADMQLRGSKHGPEMLDKAEKLMGRAMTGPEMARMHKRGKAKMPLMEMTHALAGTAFDLIEKMRGLSDQSDNPASVLMMNHAVEIAATGSSLIMLGQQGMAGDIDLVMVNHGQMMLGEASGLLHEAGNSGVYSDMAKRTVQMLIGMPEDPARK